MIAVAVVAVTAAAATSTSNINSDEVVFRVKKFSFGIAYMYRIITFGKRS